MTNRLVPFLAFVLFLSLFASLAARLFRPEPPPPPPNRTTLAAASEMPGVVKTPAGDGPILRVALLLPAAEGDVTAIVDVRDVAFVPGEMRMVPLSLNRALLPEFGTYPSNFGSRLCVTPASDGLIALSLAQQHFQTTDGWRGERTADLTVTPERWIVRPGEPVIRMSDYSHAALVYVVLDREAAERTDPGTLAYWQNLFREAGREPLLDEDAVARAADAVWPEGESGRGPRGVGAHAPLNAALGLWTLGDKKGLEDLRALVAEDSGFRDRALASLKREHPDKAWVRTDPLFALQILEVLTLDDHRVQQIVGDLVGRDVIYNSGSWRLRFAPPARVFRLLDDPRADEAAIWHLERLSKVRTADEISFVDYQVDLSGEIGRYALEHPPPANREAVVAAWEKARAPYLDRLSRTGRMKATEPGTLVLILLALAFLSVLFALIPRGIRPRLRIKIIPLLYLYVATIAGGALHVVPTFAYFLAPISVILLFGWLRSDLRHPWWERAAIGITVFSALIRVAFHDDTGLIHPAIDTLGDAWYGFAWLILGRVVLTMPEHRESTAFRAFFTLHVFTVVQGTGALLTGEIDRAGMAIHTTMGVAAMALLWFSLEEPVRRLRERLRRN